MKKYINYITSTAMIAVLLGSCLKSYAQDKKQELSISVAGPFSFLNYNTTGGEIVPGNGISAGLRYSYYLNEGISVGIGAEYQTYSSDVKFQSISGQYTTIDAEEESFQFRYKATQLREKQKLGYVNVPITIQYENPGPTKLYLAAGVKIGFAVDGNYETKMDNLTTSGYYPQYNVELFGPAFAGFASTNDIKASKQDLDTKTSYSATFETGLKQKVGDRSSVYIGLYLDYGLNDIMDKNNNKNLVHYNPELPVQLHYNSTLNTPFTSDVRLISYGLKLRYALR